VAHFRGFDIVTDQPASDGGDNSAPSPFELFLTSLATCAGYFVVAFCQQRDIPTDDIHLVQRMERDDQSHMVSKITIEVSLPPSFPDKYRAAVIRAADLCTVKKHLVNPPQISVSATTSTTPTAD
jgi:ribosomal protein S12 methylthiotransferase accessory factor